MTIEKGQRSFSIESERRFLENWIAIQHFHGYQPIRRLNFAGEVIFDISDGFNEKVWQECYFPSLLTGVVKSPYFSFDVFGCLRDWMKFHHPYEWEKVKDLLRRKPTFADSYFQVIFPLVPREIKQVLLEIGIQAYQEDFQLRSIPSGIFLPETAADTETLNLLAERGMRFVVLGRYQIKAEKDRLFYNISLSGGKKIIALCFDPELSGAIAFQPQPISPERYLEEMESRASGLGFIPFAANDWETLGHHRADRLSLFQSLDSLVEKIRPNLNRVEQNIEEGLLVEKSSWSCSHCLGRWSGENDCSCDGTDAETRREKKQLFDGLTEHINGAIALLKKEPAWQNNFIRWFLFQRQKLANGFPVTKEGLFSRFPEEHERLLIALLGLTSCGWFGGRPDTFERQIPRHSLQFLNSKFS